MKKLISVLLLTAIVSITVGAQTGALYDYSLVYQGNRTNWIGSGDDVFNISTGAVGIKVGQIPSDGFGFTWAFSTLAPFSLTFIDVDGSRETKLFNEARFGFGIGLRGGVAYALRPVDSVAVVPALGWNFTYSNYAFNFPGGSQSYTESTTGPFVSVDTALRLVDQFWLRAGIAVAYEPFYSERTSTSGANEDYRNGIVARFSAGVRIPFQLTQLFRGRF